MSGNIIEYAEMFGNIGNEDSIMARCACVACNSCTCGCSCRCNPEMEEIEW